MGRLEGLGREHQLPQVFGAEGTPGRLPRGLHSGQQQADQDANHPDDDDQLDQGEAGPTPGDSPCAGHLWPSIMMVIGNLMRSAAEVRPICTS